MLHLREDPHKCDIWDEGWGPTPQFKGNLPTIQGWQTWTSELPDPRGIKIRSAEAIRRWEHDKWSSAITFYETYNMAWKSNESSETNPRFPRNVYDKDIRIISPTETEKCLGFLQTGLDQKTATSTHTQGAIDEETPWDTHLQCPSLPASLSLCAHASKLPGSQQ